MKQSKLLVFRDSAPTDAKEPYIVYEFVNENHKRASNKILKDMPLYHIAVITKGTEEDITPLKKVFNDAGVSYAKFTGLPYDENDDTITQFTTYVRCING